MGGDRNHRKAIDYTSQSDDRLPVSSARHLERMNESFRKAMLAAIARGEECCPTTVSTSQGTRRPILIRPE
jgi:hypothetical protein